MKSRKQVYFVVSISLGLLLCYLVEHIYRSYIEHTIRQGHNIQQWLQILRNGTNEPLQIVHIARLDKSRDVEVEVALSYDALETNGFLQINWPKAVINGLANSTDFDRATNGDLIMGCDISYFSNGMNQVQVELRIFHHHERGPGIVGLGPAAEFFTTNVTPMRVFP